MTAFSRNRVNLVTGFLVDDSDTEFHVGQTRLPVGAHYRPVLRDLVVVLTCTFYAAGTSLMGISAATALDDPNDGSMGFPYTIIGASPTPPTLNSVGVAAENLSNPGKGAYDTAFSYNAGPWFGPWIEAVIIASFGLGQTAIVNVDLWYNNGS